MRSQLHNQHLHPGTEPVSQAHSMSGTDLLTNSRRLQMPLISSATEGRMTELKQEADNLSEQSAALTQTSILRHVYECKMDNKLRLKQVRNLEELIRFRIKTVSKNLVEDGTLVNSLSKQNGLYELRKVVDPLLTTTALPAVIRQKPHNSLRSKTQILRPDSLIAEKNLLDHDISIEQIEQEDQSIKQEVTFIEKNVTKTEVENKKSRFAVLQPTTVLTSKTNSAIKRIERKSDINQQIDEILKLDQNDPIRKLQTYFKDSHYGHEFNEDGQRIPKKYRAPKHMNPVMQRYENQRQRAQLRKAGKAGVGRAASQPHHDDMSQMSDELSLNKSLDNDFDYTMNPEFNNSQLLQSYQQQRVQGSVGLPNPRAKSEQRLMQTNFLSQLKQLQELLKESMLDAVEDEDGERKIEALNGSKQSVEAGGQSLTFAVDNKVNDKPNMLALPKLRKGLSNESKVSSFSQSMRRGSTRKNLDMLDQISSYKHDAKDLVHKYFPTNGEIDEQENHNETSLSSQESGTVVQTIGEADSETSESERERKQRKKKRQSIRQVGTVERNARRETINAKLLQGVDSDEEVLEELMKNAKELKQMQQESKTKRNSNEEVEQLMQLQKLRQQMANGLKLLSDPSQLTYEQRALIEKVTGKQVSTMFQIQAVRDKDYVRYNEEQLRIFKILNSQNESQKRMARVHEKRADYQGSQDRAILSQKAFMGARTFEQKSEVRRSYGSHGRLIQPFSKKKFVEDIHKPGFDLRTDKAADKLPKIMYGTNKYAKPTAHSSVSLPVKEIAGQKQVKLELHVNSKDGSQAEEQVVKLNDKSARTSLSKQRRRKNKESLQNAVQGNFNISLAAKLKQNLMVVTNSQQRRIPIVIRDKKIASAGFDVENDRNNSQLDTEMMGISGVSPFKQTQRDSSLNSGDGLQKPHARSQFMTYQGPKVNVAPKGEIDLNQDLKKHSIAIGEDDVNIDDVDGRSIKQVVSDKIIAQHVSKENKNSENSEQEDTVQMDQSELQKTIGPDSPGSRQNIPLINNVSPLGNIIHEVSVELSNDQFSSELVGPHSRLQRNQSSLNQETDKALQHDLSSKDQVVAQASTSDIHGNISISRKQSYLIYHESLGTAIEGDVTSHPLSRGATQDGLALPDSLGTPINTMLVKSAAQMNKDGKAAVIEGVLSHGEQTHCANINFTNTKNDESRENLHININLKNAQPETAKTLEKVEEQDQRQMPLLSPAFQDAGAPKKVQIRHGSAGNTGESASEDRPGSIETQRQQMTSTISNNQQAFRMPKRDSGIQTQTNIVDYPSSSYATGKIGLHLGGIRQAAQFDVGTHSGYESEIQGIDPNSVQFKRDVAESLMHSKQQMRAKGWQAKRFKKFPRFSIYLQKDKTNSHLERNYISLNNRMLAYLAEQDPEPKTQEVPVVPKIMTKQQPTIFHDRSTDSLVSATNAILLIELDETKIGKEQLPNFNNGDNMKPHQSKQVNPITNDKSLETLTVTKQITLKTKICDPSARNELQWTEEDQSPAMRESETEVESRVNTKSNVSLIITAQNPSQELLQNTKSQQLQENAHSVTSMMEPSEIRLEAITKPHNQKNNGKNKNVEQLPYMQDKQSSNGSIKGLIAFSSAPELAQNKNEVFVPTTTVIDPFDKVLLLKNIDNAILTSFRTLNKQNNVISSTLKVIHNKFTPKLLSKHVKNTFKKATMALYSVSEAESSDDGEQDLSSQANNTDYAKIRMQSQQQKNRDIMSKNKIKRGIDINSNNAYDESLLSSAQDSPAGKLGTDPSQNFAALQPYELIPSGDGLANKSLTTVEGDAEHQLVQLEEKLEKTNTNIPQKRVSSPTTHNVLPANDISSGQPTHGYGNAEPTQDDYVNYHDEVIQKQNRLQMGEPTFQDKTRQTAAFGCDQPKTQGNDNFDVWSSQDKVITTGANNSRRPSKPDSVAADTVLNNKFQRMDDQESSKREIFKSSQGNAMHINSSIPTAPQSNDHRKESQTRFSTEPETNILLQVVNEPMPNRDLYVSKIDSKEMQLKVQSKMMPNVPTDTEAAKKSTLGQKRQFRDRMPVAQQIGKKVKVQEAKVEDYLGMLGKISPPPYAVGGPGFKTSKIILQVNKRNQDLPIQQKHGRSKTQMEVKPHGSPENKQIQQHHLPKQNAQRQFIAQLSNNTSSTFVFNDSLYTKLQAGRNQGMTDQDRSHSTSQAAQKWTVNNSQHQSFESPAPVNYAQQLNSINQIQLGHRPPGPYTIITMDENFNGKPAPPTDYNQVLSKQVVGKEGNGEHVSVHLNKLQSSGHFLSNSLGIESQNFLEQTQDEKFIQKEDEKNTKLPLDGSFSQTNPFKRTEQTQKEIEQNSSFDLNKPMPNTANQNTQRITNNDISTKRVDTANVVSSNNELSIYQKQEGVIRVQNLIVGHETPKLLQPSLSNLDQMLVRQSPSHASGIDESIGILAGKMQHNDVVAKFGSPEMTTIHSLRNSNVISATVDQPFVDASPHVGRVKPQIQSVDGQTKILEIKENKSQQQFRQTALIKQGLKPSGGPFVKVPQPTEILPTQEDLNEIRKDSCFTLKKPLSSNRSHDHKKSNESIIETQLGVDQLVIETHRRSTERSHGDDVSEINEQHKIAQRIVMPQSVHRVRQMIDSLCQKEKSVVYQNPNVREDCVGTQNSIFDLSASHMIDRPGFLNGQAKLAEKNIKNLDSEADFCGNSFLAGQKATIQPKPVRSLEKRILIETKRLGRASANTDLTQM